MFNAVQLNTCSCTLPRDQKNWPWHFGPDPRGWVALAYSWHRRRCFMVWLGQPRGNRTADRLVLCDELSDHYIFILKKSRDWLGPNSTSAHQEKARYTRWPVCPWPYLRWIADQHLNIILGIIFAHLTITYIFPKKMLILWRSFNTRRYELVERVILQLHQPEQSFSWSWTEHFLRVPNCAKLHQVTRQRCVKASLQQVLKWFR